jgi:cell division protein ZapE
MPLPSEIFNTKIAQKDIEDDAAQASVIKILDGIYKDLVKRHQARQSSLGKIRRSIKPRPPVRGLYLWGSVGIGKTFMMDLFYEHLPVKKTRLHFHNFMRQLHQDLRAQQGCKDPLKKIARKIADDYLVICFDEFFVNNITDAILLRNLFEYLFGAGICLVTTSNTAPDNLYLDGLQRQQFLPVIELIKTHTETIHLQSTKDYRTQKICKEGIYYTPNDKHAEHNLEICFQHFCETKISQETEITVINRTINMVKRSDDVIWFNFNDICQPPRSQDDYLDLCKSFHTIIISNVPVIDERDNSSITLFIKFIDVLYDQRRRIILSAQTDIDGIYTKGRKSFDFNRTRSRLIEMNSPEYFSKDSNT